MIPKEILQKVKRIEIKTSRMVSDVFAGQYHSVFKGQGIEFDEVREYLPGDDIRTIDWNVTARTGIPHVKKFVEERELTVMILVDVSASSQFSSSGVLKSQLAAEMASLLALSATRNNDKVGFIAFSDHIEKFIPPRKGRSHVLRLIREILYFQPEHQGTDIIGALEYLNRVTTRKSIVFLLSDFLQSPTPVTLGRSRDLKKVLAIAHKRHDLIAVTLNDPREYSLPAQGGLFMLQDVETGKVLEVDPAAKQVRHAYESFNRQRRQVRELMFKSIGMDYIDVFTDTAYVDEMVKFFLKRRRRLRG